VVVSQFFYRDPDAIQKHIEDREAVKDLKVPHARPEQGRIYRSERTSGLIPPHQTMSIPPPPHPWFSGSDWLALRDSIHEQCKGLLTDALDELAQADKLAMLSLRRYEIGFADAPAQLPRVCQYYSRLDPAERLALILSLTSKRGWPIAALDLEPGCPLIQHGMRALKPLMQVPPTTLAGIRQLSLAPAVTADELADGSDEAFRHLLSVPTALAELNIIFDERNRCYFNSAYMAIIAECLSNAPLTSTSITEAHLSAAGLGNLLESQGRTLQSLRFRRIYFSGGDNSWAMLGQVRASTMLRSLELFDLTHGDSPIAMDWKAPGSSFSARGKAAVQDLWRHYMACYDPCWFQRYQQMACER
jgi:hypothetical protein